MSDEDVEVLKCAGRIATELVRVGKLSGRAMTAEKEEIGSGGSDGNTA
jgi:hypothetical protein